MRPMLVSLALGFGLAFSGSALAMPVHNPETGTTATGQIEPVSQQLICRAPVHEGLLLPRAKQCYTKVEWEARQKRMQQSIRELQMRSMIQLPGR